MSSLSTSVGDERNSGYLLNPAAVLSAGHGASQNREHVAIGEHHEARPQGRNDLVFQTIGKIRGVTRSILQDETARGPVWDLQKNLQPLGDQPWRLFAGAWGELGGEAHATGPLGPWFKRQLDPNEKVVME